MKDKFSGFIKKIMFEKIGIDDRTIKLMDDFLKTEYAKNMGLITRRVLIQIGIRYYILKNT